MRPIDDFEKIRPKYVHEDFNIRKINDYPYIVKINNLLNKEEVKEILKLAKGKFEKSNIVVDGKIVYNDKQRNSSTAYIVDDGIPKKYNEVLERFIKRIRHLTGCKRSQIEMMCVRYKKGEQFNKHVDYFREDEIGILDRGGQRIGTFFVYLNTLDKNDGGDTEFTKLGIVSHPKRGDSLFWWNKDFKSGQTIPETEHCGNPVLTDTIKYGLNIWIRETPFF